MGRKLIERGAAGTARPAWSAHGGTAFLSSRRRWTGRPAAKTGAVASARITRSGAMRLMGTSIIEVEGLTVSHGLTPVPARPGAPRR